MDDEAGRGADGCYVRARDIVLCVQECRAGREAPLVSRLPRVRLMGALPSRVRGPRVPQRCDGLAASGLPGRVRPGLAFGMGGVATVIEGG